VEPESVLEDVADEFWGSFSGYERDRLFYNSGQSGRPFVQASYVLGLDQNHDGRSAASVDVDGDGDLDLVLLTLQGLKLFENTSNEKHFSRIRLVGEAPAQGAVGAEVAVTAGGIRRQDFVKITDGFRTQVPRDLHFGLGEIEIIEKIEVRWNSGKYEVWHDLPVDRLLLVREGEKSIEVKEITRWPESTKPTGLASPSTDFSARKVGGMTEALPTGKPVVINFWAPWCAPCNVELPVLSTLSERFKGEVDFVGMSVELDDVTSVQQTIDEFDLNYVQFFADSQVMDRFFTSTEGAALPSTFVFDRDGGIRRVFRGAITENDIEGLLLSFREESEAEAPLRLLAQTYFKSGDYEIAAGYFERLARLQPQQFSQISVNWDRKRALDWLWSGRSRRLADQHEIAMNNLRQALNRGGERNREVLYELGLTAVEARQYELAVTMFEQILEIDPDDDRARRQLDRVQARQ
tara:strand:+ start:2585 stop:3979 length:1395 start_codon:yes stop_codon:yes gene_type:complete